MKKVFYVILFLNLILSAAFIYAESSEDIFKKANSLYENEDYENAANLYESLIKTDKISSEVFYNLGNSYFKLKRLGRAIVNYERALRLSPRDRDILQNIQLARSLTIDKIEKSDRGFLLDMALFLYDRMNIDELTKATYILYLLIITFLIFAIFLVEKRKMLIYTTLITGGLFVVFVIFLVSKIYSERFVKKAIVISETLDVKSGPKEDYLLQFTLHEGTKVRIVEKEKDWYEIDLSKDLRGWVPVEGLEVI